MLVMSVGKSGVIASGADAQKVDMFEINLAKRDFGRLASNRNNEHIGFFAMNYDGKRLFEPMGHSCCRNPNYNKKLLDYICRYYNENHTLFLEMPRYSESEIKLWERRIEENPEERTPWDACRKLFRGRRIQELNTLVVAVDGEKHIGHLCRTKNQDFLLCGMY